MKRFILFLIPFGLFALNAHAQFGHYAEFGLVLPECSLDTFSDFRSGEFLKVSILIEDGSEISPATMIDKNGQILVPYNKKYRQLMAGENYVYYQTYEHEVGYYSVLGSDHNVWHDYIELIAVQGDTLLVRNRDNKVGLVSHAGNIIIPFDYYHAWGDGIDHKGRMLLSKGLDTWTYNMQGDTLDQGWLR